LVERDVISKPVSQEALRLTPQDQEQPGKRDKFSSPRYPILPIISQLLIS
jgi:hypothetical protein